MNVAVACVCGEWHYACGSSWCLWREALCMWQQMVFVEGGAVHECGSSWCLWREALCMNVAADGVCGEQRCAWMWQQLLFVERGTVHECVSSWCFWRAALCMVILPGLDSFHALLQVVVVFLQGFLLCCLPLHTVQSVQNSTPHSTALSKHSTKHNMKLSTARCTIQYHTPHSSSQ